MAAIAGDDAALDRGFVRLDASMPLDVDPDRVADLLEADASGWLPDAERLPDAGGLRRYAVDLRLRVGREDAAVTTFRKAAFLDLGPGRREGARSGVEISWRAASAAPLFPVFAGRLTVEPGELRIEGLYAPPGGAAGRIADRLLLHTAANATARWLLGALAQAAHDESV
jgi:hypothetical protein